MRKLVALSAAAVMAVFVGSAVAKADTPAWYLTFQHDACVANPGQAGCIGFDRSSSMGQRAVEPEMRSHRRH